MNTINAQFDAYDGSDPSEYQPAKTWLYQQLGLREEFDEDFSLLNSDRGRALEFADFYFTHPELRGCRRGLCAELVVDSAVHFIEPDPAEGYVPAQDEVAEALVRQLLTDQYTRFYLLEYVRASMREAGYYPRIVSLVDRLEEQTP